LAEEARLAAEAAAEAARIEAERLAAEEKERKLKMLPTYQTRRIKQLAQNPDIQGFDFSALTSEFILEQLADVEAELAWVVVCVPEDTPTTVKIVGRGKGGPTEIVPLLTDEDILYGALRVIAVDRKGTKLSLRSRIVYFTWNGSLVSSKTRFRNTTVVRGMSAYFTGISLEIKCNHDTSDLNESAIVAALTKATNHHGEFKFGHYDKEKQADEYIAQLQTALNAFAGLDSAPRTGIVSRSALKKELEAKVAELMEQLEDLDDLVIQFDTTPAGLAFIAAWRKARIIVDGGHGPSTDDPTSPAPTA
jgi:hypothetical protein